MAQHDALPSMQRCVAPHPPATHMPHLPASSVCMQMGDEGTVVHPTPRLSVLIEGAGVVDRVMLAWKAAGAGGPVGVFVGVKRSVLWMPLVEEGAAVQEVVVKLDELGAGASVNGKPVCSEVGGKGRGYCGMRGSEIESRRPRMGRMWPGNGAALRYCCSTLGALRCWLFLT
jgi:hypothetical protein